MNALNSGETDGILYRKRGYEQAEYLLSVVLPGLSISVISSDFSTVIAASKIKARHTLSFADCFAVATARGENATILTGDPEFKHVKELVKIDWLTK